MVTGVYCLPNGQFYFMDSSGIATVRDDHVQRLPLLPGHTGYSDHYLFVGLVELPDHSLVTSVGGANEHDLWRFKDGKWQRFLPDVALPEVTAMFGDSAGQLYLGYRGEQISLVRDKTVETLTTGSPRSGRHGRISANLLRNLCVRYEWHRH
jgi:hypothetical protein